MFEVSKPGATPNYVFGTMHVADRDVLRLPPPIARAFKGSRMLLVESDHAPVESYKIVEAMFLPEGRSLQDMLKPALYEEIVTAAEPVGMKERDVNRLRPWAIWILLGDPSDESVRRASGQPVLDDALRLYASKRGVPVMALDRAAEIAALFTVGLSEADQLQLLENALRDPMSYDERYNAMRQSYLAGDLEALLMSMRPDDKTDTEAQRQFADRFNHGL
ncbi:MAG: TraB/GumN family protein, partial [Alphaproteobacteria bacterium]|nr:TraB/GumN family protein [Alphaproteobacteria bacterium]